MSIHARHFKRMTAEAGRGFSLVSPSWGRVFSSLAEKVEESGYDGRERDDDEVEDEKVS